MSAPRPWIEAFAPATVSNLGPGFDCLGLAVRGAGDRVRARRRDEPGVALVKVEGDGGKLPREIENYVSRMMVLGWPRRVVLNAKNISYLAALMTADYFVGTQRARAIARRAAQIGC